jgi:environmental stress-induced protein Ves
MRIIRHASFVSSAWKNGLGITHEIARDGTEPFGWRLSVAGVAQDGPFSLFQGYRRWLTVIDGKGMVLESKTGSIGAAPLVPVHFSGDININGRLVDGACRDFNLIYDPLRFDGVAEVATNAEPLIRSPCGDDVLGVYVVDGYGFARSVKIEAGDFAFLEDVNDRMDFNCATRLSVSLRRV